MFNLALALALAHSDSNAADWYFCYFGLAQASTERGCKRNHSWFSSVCLSILHKVLHTVGALQSYARAPVADPELSKFGFVIFGGALGKTGGAVGQQSRKKGSCRGWF